MNDPSGLRCTDLRVRAGGRTILDGVSVSVAPGSLTAVVGASGSGKTTLLRAIAGFHTLDTGSVLIDGENITDTPPEQRPIASLFQTARLFPALSVRSNVAFGLRVRGVRLEERNDRADYLLAQVGLADRADDSVEALSGGEQQRVALARALAFTPALVLMDEPFSAVDTPRRRELRALVDQLLREYQIPSMLVTHDIADAKSLADRLVVIDNGRILQEGPLTDVLATPANPVVADLTGGGS